MPAVFDRYSNSFLKIYFDIPPGREDELARKVLIKHLQSGNSYGIVLKEQHAKFPQPELGSWVEARPRRDRRHAAGASPRSTATARKFDARDLTIRKINAELRRLVYEEGVTDVTISNPGAKHSLGVGHLHALPDHVRRVARLLRAAA